ncbi:MAG: aldose 1-epimerase [Vibrio sp.]
MVNLHRIENEFFSLVINENGCCVSSLIYKPNQFNLLREQHIENMKFAGESGMFPMLPMANRIAGNQFNWQGETVKLPLHSYDKQFFLHGDGWIQQWQCIEHSSSSLIFSCESKLDKIYHYHAEICFSLHNHKVKIELTIKNLSHRSFPFGGGFHPFFTVLPDSKVSFQAEGVWLENESYLPTDYLNKIPSDLDFSEFRIIPEIWINNGYQLATSALAVIEHPNNIQVKISSPCRYLQVYKPAGQSQFLCIEPQSHFVNAHNSTDYESLRILAHQESMKISMEIEVKPRE